MATTGQKVEVSGIYKCTNCGNEITCVEGKRLPPCSKCRGTDFVIVRKTR